MLARIILVLTTFCGILKSHDGVHGDFLLDKDDVKKYGDLLADDENRELIQTLFSQAVPSHNRLPPETVARLKKFEEKIRNRSDLVVEILKKERVDFRGEISSKEYDSLSRSVMILNFVRNRKMSHPEKIVEEVRLRLLPWRDFKLWHRNGHEYLSSHFEILLSYGDLSDLERIGLFKDHPDGMTRFSAENAYSRLEKRLSEESNKRSQTGLTARNRYERADGRQGIEKELSGNSNDSENLWWCIIGIVLAGAGGIWVYKRRALP